MLTKYLNGDYDLANSFVIGDRITDVKLAQNLDRYLLGMDRAPTWVFDPSDACSAKVAAWWAKRWASVRISRDDVLVNVRHEGLAHPIRHRARVKLPEGDDGQGAMF